ncbi:hypothetical protein AVEN_130620-1 [Araneus ventricosus]|uniref:Uncharacterized protein n=1 Tax=Araneus ventricosus TaxID=182803 RepID=A0A4Y2PPB8_ARAVE|nr:hypothetical protein AVEN_130620-1 [Araneus ventricosus]
MCWYWLRHRLAWFGKRLRDLLDCRERALAVIGWCQSVEPLLNSGWIQIRSKIRRNVGGFLSQKQLCQVHDSARLLMHCIRKSWIKKEKPVVSKKEA